MLNFEQELCSLYPAPVWVLAYGLALTALSEWIDRRSAANPPTGASGALSPINGVTRVMGLLHVFLPLWILSIWGDAAEGIRQGSFGWDRLMWTLLFGAAAAVAVARALKTDESILRGFGLTFFFINLYTAFFDFFWNSINKAIFFSILAVSF